MWLMFSQAWICYNIHTHRLILTARNRNEEATEKVNIEVSLSLFPCFHRFSMFWLPLILLLHSSLPIYETALQQIHHSNRWWVFLLLSDVSFDIISGSRKEGTGGTAGTQLSLSHPLLSDPLHRRLAVYSWMSFLWHQTHRLGGEEQQW